MYVLYMCFTDLGKKTTKESITEASSAWSLLYNYAVTIGLSLPRGH